MKGILNNRGRPYSPRLFILIGLVVLTLMPSYLWAQVHPNAGREVEEDTMSVLHSLRKGTTDIRLRYFSMATVNEDSLKDFFANAAAITLRYETAPYHGFRAAAGGSFIFNLWSSDFSEPDPYTNISSRYEAGLFDLQHPQETQALSRLEFLYLQYKYKNAAVTLGKQLLNTPFVNPQDGRMRPTLADGVYLQLHPSKFKLEAGWLYQLAPRSTIEWYTVAGSLGIFPNGLDVNGAPAAYAGNLSSKGIGLWGMSYAVSDKLEVKIWDQFTDNIFNAWLLEAEWNKPPALKFFAGLRVIGENAVNDGGNADPQKTYFAKGARSFVVTARSGYRWHDWETSLNYSRITRAGRFLLPREWGIEPLYTFLYRERNEGAGDVHALSWKLKNTACHQQLVSEAGLGYYRFPDVKNYALNKYGMPSYGQLYLDIRYAATKKWKGLDLELLYVYKKCFGENYDNGKFIMNKVNLSNFNFIINYRLTR